MTIFLSSHGSRRPTSNGGLRYWLQASISAGVFVCTSALATDVDEVNRLLQAGKHSEAMKTIEASLKRDPKNPRMRFAKGVVLAERKNHKEAIAVFQQLSEDYPDLPEPHNNLAVLYSQDNQFEKARMALNSAIRTNPSYATAYENLGDVHARIAAQSYSKALNTQANTQASSQSKLKMLAALNIPEPAAAPAVSAPAVTAPPATASTVTAPSDLAKQGTGASSSGAQAALPARSPAPIAVAPPPATKPEVSSTVAAIQPKVNAAPPAPAPLADKASVQQEIASAVQAWETAWETKDMGAYVAAYDQGYYASGSRNHKQWVNLRKARILGKDRITITVENPVMDITGDTAVVRFRQIYEGGNVHSDGLKTLTLRKKTGKWKITKEIAAD